MKMPNKRSLIISAVIAAIVIGIIVGISFLIPALNQRDVAIKLSAKVDSVEIYPENDSDSSVDPIHTIQRDSNLKFSDGNYYAIPSGTDVDTSAISFTVDELVKSVLINPNYSKTYLQTQLQNNGEVKIEQADSTSDISITVPANRSLIHSIIRTKYRGIIDNYDINTGELLGDGSWYVTYMVKKGFDPAIESANFFKTILHYDGVWQIMAEPDVVFRYDDFPDVPKEIIKLANQY
jgi:hypothetical protein